MFFVFVFFVFCFLVTHACVVAAFLSPVRWVADVRPPARSQAMTPPEYGLEEFVDGVEALDLEDDVMMVRSRSGCDVVVVVYLVAVVQELNRPASVAGIEGLDTIRGD